MLLAMKNNTMTLFYLFYNKRFFHVSATEKPLNWFILLLTRKFVKIRFIYLFIYYNPLEEFVRGMICSSSQMRSCCQVTFISIPQLRKKWVLKMKKDAWILQHHKSHSKIPAVPAPL